MVKGEGDGRERWVGEKKKRGGWEREGKGTRERRRWGCVRRKRRDVNECIFDFFCRKYTQFSKDLFHSYDELLTSAATCHISQLQHSACSNITFTII